MRITNVYTGSGDDGYTNLADGTRVPKDHPRVSVCGSLDEACAAVCCARSFLENEEDLGAVLVAIQHRLFDAGAALCMPGAADPAKCAYMADQAGELEARMDEWTGKLGALDEFILPGGSRASALLHLARTIVRRAERDAVTLSRDEDVPGEVLLYLNRVGDALFVLAREIVRRAGAEEVKWKRGG